jgi:hypothetical protein
MKYETPNQIMAWIRPPRRASVGVRRSPPDAIAAPNTKPTAAQKIGFEVGTLKVCSY